MNERPSAPPVPPDAHSLRAPFFKIAVHRSLNRLMTAVIVANIILMGSVHHGQPQVYEDFLEVASAFFTIVYTVEALVKIVGLSPFGLATLDSLAL
jgi:hypothetical protein